MVLLHAVVRCIKLTANNAIQNDKHKTTTATRASVACDTEPLTAGAFPSRLMVLSDIKNAMRQDLKTIQKGFFCVQKGRDRPRPTY